MDIQESRYNNYWATGAATGTTKTETGVDFLSSQMEESESKNKTSQASTVTGKGQGVLDVETQRAIMDATQKADEDPLAVAFRNDLDDIARDPVYAAKQAEKLGTLGELFFMDGDLPPNGSPAEVWERFTKNGNERIELMQEIQKKRTAYYEELSDQGLSGVQMYEKLLEFNANLPDSYADKLGWSAQQNGGMTYSEFRTHQLDYLRNAMQTQQAAV